VHTLSEAFILTCVSIFDVTGDWVHYTHFQEWRREREVTENTILHMNGLVKATTHQEESSAKTAAAYIEQEAEKSQKRKTQAMYARRKRLKRRVAAENLEAHSKSLEAENVALKKTQAHLMSLLVQAERIVQVISTASNSESALPLSRAIGHGIERHQDRTVSRLSNPFNLVQAGSQNSLLSTALAQSGLGRELPVSSSLGPSPLRGQQDLLQRHSYPNNLLSSSLGRSYEQLGGREIPRHLSQFGSLTGRIVGRPSGHRDLVQSQLELNSLWNEGNSVPISNADVFTFDDVMRHQPSRNPGLSLLNQAIARQEQVSSQQVPLLESLLLSQSLQTTLDNQNLTLQQLLSEPAAQVPGRSPQNQELLNLISTLLGQRQSH